MSRVRCTLCIVSPSLPEALGEHFVLHFLADATVEVDKWDAAMSWSKRLLFCVLLYATKKLKKKGHRLHSQDHSEC